MPRDSPRCCAATRRCNRSSRPPGARTGSRVFAFLSAPVDTPPSRAGSLANNGLCGLYYDAYGDIQGTHTAESITMLCEGLKGSSVTSLKCATCSLSCQRPLTRLPLSSRLFSSLAVSQATASETRVPLHSPPSSTRRRSPTSSAPLPLQAFAFMSAPVDMPAHTTHPLQSRGK